MTRARAFLTKEERLSVESAIAAAEKLSSGEIRIHIETICPTEPKERALRTFHILGMKKTAARNGVLIYVASASRKVAVIGDSGINAVVPHGFWKDVVDVLTDSFARNDNAEGLKKAVLLIGEKLSYFFPYSKDDVNELPNEISFEDETVGDSQPNDEK